MGDGDILGSHAHEYIQDIHLHLVAGIAFQMGGVRDRNCGRCLLAGVFSSLSSPADHICSSDFGLSDLRMVEANKLVNCPDLEADDAPLREANSGNADGKRARATYEGQ